MDTDHAHGPAEPAPTEEITWYSGCPDFPQLGDRFTMRPPRAKVCNDQCPWLIDNQDRKVDLWYDHEVSGIPMPDGAFTFDSWKRAEVWAGDLRDGIPGYGSLCHVRLEGTKKRPDETWDYVGHQCTGALVMQQRELLRLVEQGSSALSRRGAAHVASNTLGRSISEDEVEHVDLFELLTRTHELLLSESIGAGAVAPPLDHSEVSRWSQVRRSRDEG